MRSKNWRHSTLTSSLCLFVVFFHTGKRGRAEPSKRELIAVGEVPQREAGAQRDSAREGVADLEVTKEARAIGFLEIDRDAKRRP